MARLSRAQALTGTNRATEIWSDIKNNFDKSPVGNSLARVTNNESVQQSIKNLLFTNLGERLFQPWIGSGLTSLLFDLNLLENLTAAEYFIQNTIEKDEPRVHFIGASVKSIGEHEVEATIVYSLINNPEQISFSVIFKRVR